MQAQDENNFFIEVWNSILQQVKDKLASPLLAPFAFSWFAFNYDFLIIMFGDGSFSKKIRYLHEDVYQTLYIYGYGTIESHHAVKFIFWVVIPLISSLSFLYLYPWLAKRALGKWLKWEVTKSKTIMDGKKQIPLSEDLKIEMQSKISMLYNQLKEQRIENADLHQTISTYQQTIDTLETKLVMLEKIGKDVTVENKNTSEVDDCFELEIEPFKRNKLYNSGYIDALIKDYNNNSLSSVNPDSVEALQDYLNLGLIEIKDKKVSPSEKLYKTIRLYNELWIKLLTREDIKWAYSPKYESSFAKVNDDQKVILSCLHKFGGVLDFHSMEKYYSNCETKTEFEVVLRQILDKGYVTDEFIESFNHEKNISETELFYRLSALGVSYCYFLKNDNVDAN